MQNVSSRESVPLVDSQSRSFGETHFEKAELGDRRRTKRLIRVADALVRHPGGSLPEKLRNPGELDGLYHLLKSPTVTHEAILAPHRGLTLQKVAAQDGPVLILHDTTELDYTTRESLADVGPIGNGSRKGWLCHNSLAVSFPHREVLGLASQILHRRAAAPAQESMKSRRERATRESRLWLVIRHVRIFG